MGCTTGCVRTDRRSTPRYGAVWRSTTQDGAVRPRTARYVALLRARVQSCNPLLLPAHCSLLPAPLYTPPMSSAPPFSSSGSPGSTDEHPHRYTAAVANAIELKWQAAWEESNAFHTPNPGEHGFDGSRPKFYCLDMFPYPSGSGLHVGHPEGYTATDVISRYKRLRGFNVLHPMGWDAFGLPAEQYAVQTGVHPSITTLKAIDTFRRQLKRFGFSYDWSRELSTIDPDYYRWTQWIWLQAYHAWYDPSVNAARPIADLLRELENNLAYIGPSGEVIRGQVSTHLEVLGGEPIGARRWQELSRDEQRDFLGDLRLAYRGEQTVNWCPKLGTVLANEEVIDGRSERGGHPVFRLPLKQWMFRITAYAERLLKDLELIRWPESTRTMQSEWIGRSEGAEIDFELETGGESKDPGDVLQLEEIGFLRVFTTRPDTIFGATYMVVAPEHALVDAVMAAGARNPRTPPSGADAAAIASYVTTARNRSDIDRLADTREKTGVFLGVMAVNPATGESIPVWTADYVLMGYGHGAIMAVPAHDQRDFAFARRFNLPIRQVVRPSPDTPSDPAHAAFAETVAAWTTAFTEEGIACNSANAEVALDGLWTSEATRAAIEWLDGAGLGSRRVTYRLRDWLFSRQRYWGEPFPIVFDEAGNHYPVREDFLPVRLPEMEDYKPVEHSTPVPPLSKATHWVNTTAGEAGVDASNLAPETRVWRETNTMPNWAGSCWYYLRYCDPHNTQRFVGAEAESYWMTSARADGSPHAGGVDLYVGGSEHAVLHLLYARFWHKMLFDLGFVSTPEPAGRLFHQGLILAPAFQRDDRTLVATDEVDEISEGSFVERATGTPVIQTIAKMSKSLKNVINPDDVIAEYGADTFRLYEMCMGPLEASKPWNPRDIAGPFRFLQRLWRLALDERTGEVTLGQEDHPELERLLHRTIHRVGGDIERLSMNTAIAALIEFVNAATSSAAAGTPLSVDQMQRLLCAVAPFAPHLAEELWERLGAASNASTSAGASSRGTGRAATVALSTWPVIDPAMLIDDEIEMPVAFNGKVKHRVIVPATAESKDIERLALADSKVIELLAGKPIRKIVVVPGKMVNIVHG